MQYIFLAVVIVMVLLNGFMYMAVKRLADSVGKQIRSQSTRLFSICNHVQTVKIEGQTESAEEENTAPFKSEETEEQAQSTSMADTISKSMLKPSPKYRNTRFLRDYTTLKRRFAFDKQELIMSVISQNLTPGPAAKILEKLSLDNVYKLSNIDAKHQERILKELLTQEQISYIDDITSEMSGFDITALYYKLRLLAQIEDGKAHLLVPDGSGYLEDIAPNVEVEHSHEICEGVQVLIGNKLYDYSIGKREIG